MRELFRRVACICRGGTSLALFVVFGIGAILITPLMLIMRSRQTCQPVVRATWRFAAWLFEATGLIRVKNKGLGGQKGTIIVSNHPSLIDVVLYIVLVPRTLYVAKHALLKNPFLSAIVRHTSLPDDARLPEAAAPYLADGWNVLVFPEGTRSPSPDVLRDFHRGAAQLALRTGAEVVCVGLDVSRAILGKRQKPWDMGERRVVYSFAADEPIKPSLDPSRGLRPQAEELTDVIRERISTQMAASRRSR